MKREKKKISLKYKKVKFSGATRLMNWSRAQPSGCKTKIRLDVFTGCPIITVPNLKSSSFGTALVRHTCSPHLTRMWLCHPPTSFLSNLSLVSSIKKKTILAFFINRFRYLFGLVISWSLTDASFDKVT